MQHLEKFGSTWKNSTIKFKYSVELSTDKKINKKLQMGKITRKKLIVDEQRIKGVELCKTKPESSNNFTIRSSSLDISGMNQL